MKVFQFHLDHGITQLSLFVSFIYICSHLREHANFEPQEVKLFGRQSKGVLKVFSIDHFCQLNVLPNSNTLGIKCFVPSISISFQCEFYIIMQMYYTKILNQEIWIGYNNELAESVYN